MWMGSPLMFLYVDGFPFEWMNGFHVDEMVLMGFPWRSGAFIRFGLISFVLVWVWKRYWVPLGVHTGRRLQGVRRIVPTSFYLLFGPSGDWRPWIRALGYLSDRLSERDPVGQLIEPRIGQVDGFPSLEPSTMVLSLRWRIGSSSCRRFSYYWSLVVWWRNLLKYQWRR